MKKENGITLISLVITIILILILATVSIYTGVDIYENMRVKNFVAKMQTIQVAVDKLCDKYTVQEINSKTGVNYNDASVPEKSIEVLEKVINENGNEDDATKSWYPSAGDNIKTNYRYLSKDKISSDLEIKDFDTAIFFNPRTRNIIAVKGIKYENHMYYRQYDLPKGQELNQPSLDNDFSLNVSVKTFNNKAVIYVETDKSIAELKYYKKKDNGEYGEAVTAKNIKEIPISESGTYKIEAKLFTSANENGTIIKTADNVNVAIVNKPMLAGGMTPIKYDESGNQVVTTADDEDWYNYGSETKRWANAKLKDGSVYVWIPRYAYYIHYNNSANISGGGTINVKFMKDTSSTITTSGEPLKTVVEEGNEIGYRVMPAFQNGAENGFANGEWDSELTGFWVAKYETTQRDDGKPQNILINTDSWRGLNPAKMFSLCRKMESDFKDTYFDSSIESASGRLLYGQYGKDENNIDTHLMKNSEWGAVAYLADSIYGAGATNIVKAPSYNIQDCSAPEYSSTHDNYTGIYGLSGGAFDNVAAGVNISGQYNYENKSTKYATIYNSDINTNNIYGDAMKETTRWNNNYCAYPEKLIIRGAFINTNTTSGIYSYQEKHYFAAIGDNVNSTFRPVLIVEQSSNNRILGNASQIAGNSANIGKKVNYGKLYGTYEGLKSDWEILYADDFNVYIITTGALPARNLNDALDQDYNGTSDFSNQEETINSDKYPAVADGWLYKIYSEGNLLYNSSYENMKCTEYLLDNTNPKWADLKNSKAKWVIGGPTMELLIASYNEVNTSNLKDIPDISSSAYGYPRVLSDENDLPNTNTRPWNHGTSYWLAAPSSDSADNTGGKGMRRVLDYSSTGHYANIENLLYYSGEVFSVGFRPVVCLNSNVILTENPTTHAFDLSEATE